jgi:hypothetical protein
MCARVCVYGGAVCRDRLSYWPFQTFAAPSFDDKILEVVAVFGSMQMAVSRVIKLQHHRIAQVWTTILQGLCCPPPGARTCLERWGLDLLLAHGAQERGCLLQPQGRLCTTLGPGLWVETLPTGCI